jgi:hypothetical protein
MRVLVACEASRTVAAAFEARGHEAWSCDLREAEAPGRHIVGDALEIAHRGGWDIMVAHPPCTFLALSGLHWNKRIPGRREKRDAALAFVRALLAAPVPRIALENPAGAISTHVRKPDQYVQPWMFGDPYSKLTGLWLVGLPKLVATNVLEPEAFQPNGRPRWRNQTPTGQNKLGPSPDRWRLRSLTYPGLARAMAEQWGG